MGGAEAKDSPQSGWDGAATYAKLTHISTTSFLTCMRVLSAVGRLSNPITPRGVNHLPQGRTRTSAYVEYAKQALAASQPLEKAYIGPR
jgi:hypothetical protein